MARDRRLAGVSLWVAGWHGGLVCFEELVHDFGAGGDDRA